MDQIDYADFAKVEFKIGEIKEAIKVEGSDKLIRMRVDFGEETQRTVFSGIQKYYEADYLVGKKTVFVTNVAPRKMMGELSEAMIFAASAFVETSADKSAKTTTAESAKTTTAESAKTTTAESTKTTADKESEETISILIMDKDLPVGSKVF